ncbi:hypothetical protein [Methylocella sp.]|uniref:hypothetical protein n=1 Tax=Methylocella sp. TaxID=1978226 RepID=UPI00378520EA
MSQRKIFLYAEIEAQAPFETLDWRSLAPSTTAQPGLLGGVWRAGIEPRVVGGFHEFDSLENARACADGPLVAAARALGATLRVKLFDGEAGAQANREGGPLHHAQACGRESEKAAELEARERNSAIDA